MKHANIAVFVPHEGCPHQCSFCDQRFISGTQKPPTSADVKNIIGQASTELRDSMKPAQIAFFGGSFTAMDREYMRGLLQVVQPYIDGKSFSGIRISTRPDAIDADILDILKKHHVTDIELGAQSMDNAVLKANLRGHTAEDTEKASGLIKNMGFSLGVQMMSGMYMSDTDRTVHTAQKIIKINPDYVRIYPTVVLRGTMLAKILETGKYRPQTLEEAVDCCAGLLEAFTDAGIPVIRLGLHDSPELSGNMLAGPHHPAFRELCENRIFMRKVERQIRDDKIPAEDIIIKTRPDSISKMAGHNRVNIRKLADMGYSVKIIPDSGLGYLEAKVFRRM